MRYARANPDICKRFLQAFSEGIRYFKDNREDALSVMVNPDVDGEVEDLKDGYTEEGAGAVYDWLDPRLTSKLYPTLEAIEKTYEAAVFYRAEAEDVNSMSLWDMHFLRELEDDGKLA